MQKYPDGITKMTKDIIVHYKLPVITCADPENFVRGGPTLTVFLVDERIQIPLKVDHHWPISQMQFKWRFAGGPMMAKHSNNECWLGSLMIF